MNELEALKQVLLTWGYSVKPAELEEELHDLANTLATYRDENRELDRLREIYYDEIYYD
jgi:hypothetical protein